MYISEKSFQPQLKKPESGNPYYNKKPKGYNPCILGKPNDKNLNVLANCVGWVVGRINQETSEGKCLFYGSMNACSIYIAAQRNGLPTGQEPKVGATICWSGGSNKKGHVAQVEKVISSTEILTSESGYNSYVFKNVKRKKGSNGNWGMGTSYKFQGFVYNPHIIEMAEPVERDKEKNQLRILKDKLRIRVKPSLSADILEFAIKGGIYNDLETYQADNYVWHKIGEDNWIADVNGYVELLPKVEIKIGDKVTFKQQPDYFIVSDLSGNSANVTMTTTIDNLNKLD